MFRKKCSVCENKIKSDFEFCPSCGENLKSNNDQEDYGFLGKNDLIEENEIPNMSDTIMDKMFNSAMKILEKQMKNMQKEMIKNPHQPNFKQPEIPNDLSIQFFVNGKKVFPGNQPRDQNKAQRKSFKPNNKLIQEKIKKSSNLQKKEPESKLRRLSGKIVYELQVPGVKSIEDILINQLESSIEIKALSYDKIYSKNLNINLPILKYNLKDGLLIIELKTQDN